MVVGMATNSRAAAATRRSAASWGTASAGTRGARIPRIWETIEAISWQVKIAQATQQTTAITCSTSVPSSGEVSRDHENAPGSGVASMARSRAGTPSMNATRARAAASPRSRVESALGVLIAGYLRGCG